jgi:hypothetical protein
MDEWVPRLKEQVDQENIDLTGDSGKVFDCIDGRSSIADVADKSGVPEERVRQIVKGFEEAGVLAPDEPAGERAERKAPAGTADEGARNYRKIFETELHRLPNDKRASLARSATGTVLKALCYDPDPKVISGVLENMETGLEHARLIANHHGTPQGLDALGRKSRLIRDGEVRRLLLRNNQASEALLRKALSPLPLIQVFKLNISRENTEKARRVARKQLRDKFVKGAGEERAGLIFNTEGRCLNLLMGLTFDSKTTALLTRRQYHSSLLVQNLARFPATPGQVIRHLMKQQVVRRAQHLKRMLLKHPNCPSDLKRMA